MTTSATIYRVFTAVTALAVDVQQWPFSDRDAAIQFAETATEDGYSVFTDFYAGADEEV